MEQCNNVAKEFSKPIHEKVKSETASVEVYVILTVWLLINWLLNITEQLININCEEHFFTKCLTSNSNAGFLSTYFKIKFFKELSTIIT